MFCSTMMLVLAEPVKPLKKPSNCWAFSLSKNDSFLKFLHFVFSSSWYLASTSPILKSNLLGNT